MINYRTDLIEAFDNRSIAELIDTIDEIKGEIENFESMMEITSLEDLKYIPDVYQDIVALNRALE